MFARGGMVEPISNALSILLHVGRSHTVQSGHRLFGI